ncbi:MAG: immunoglobulin domain-containing protein [Chloroflexota bacterium]
MRTTNLATRLILVLAMVASLLTVLPATAAAAAVTSGVIYVDAANTSGPQDGANWATPYSDLQTAIANATPGAGETVQIWVAEGTYKPSSTGNKAASFTLKNGVAIYGGFNGGETQLSERDPLAHPTVLSGDLTGDDADNWANRGDNSYRVVLAPAALTRSAILDGFIISGGNNSSGMSPFGGGIASEGSPTLANLVVSGNRDNNYGGGVNISSGSPWLTNVTIANNVSGGWGGGLAMLGSGSPSLTNVTFSGNSARWGGGIYFSHAGASLVDVTLTGNSAVVNGGGIYINTGSPALTNFTLANNSAVNYGGAIYVDSGNVTLTNSVLHGNSATSAGSGIFIPFEATGTVSLINTTIAGNAWDAIFNYGSNFAVSAVNSIIWISGDSSENPIYGGNVTAAYSIVQNGLVGTGNSGADPQFVNLTAGDLRLTAGSPAIDAGDNSAVSAGTDRAGNPRTFGATVDIGAYEYQGSPAEVAPVVTSHPQSQTVVEGETAIFTAAASGNPTPSVQWQVLLDGLWEDFAGASSITLTIPAVETDANGAQFRAAFSNTAGGPVYSNPATLTVTPAQTGPIVITHPQNQTVTDGDTVTFTAAATGTPTPGVQWQVLPPVPTNGIWLDVVGATSPTLSFTATMADNGNQYRAYFDNGMEGTASSDAATLTVTPAPSAPVVTTHPQSQTVTADQTATFTAAADGNPTPDVQWQGLVGDTWANIRDANSTTLELTGVTASLNGTQYRAVFDNGVGNAVTSYAATLTVNYAPVVTTDPINQTVSEGQDATFTAAASGNPTPDVQWQVLVGSSWADIIDADSTTLMISGVTTTQNGTQYRAGFDNGVGGRVYSVSATLTVTAAQMAPVVTTHPQSQTVTAGQTATFTTAASGTPAPSVQWQVGTGTSWLDLPGANGLTLSFTTEAADDGQQYRASFTNSAGGPVYSDAATLTVHYAPAVTSDPTNQTVSEGQNASFTATASGNPTPVVQWQVLSVGGSWADIAGATSTTLTLSSVTADQSGTQYQAVFSNGVGSAVMTNPATLTVNAAPTAPAITTPPQDVTVTAGQTATFNATASGSLPLQVRWQVSANGGKKWSNITDATETTLTLQNVSLSQNGYKYRAIFTNAAGTATTNAATLTVTGAAVDVSIAKAGVHNPVTGRITWTLTIHNSGPNAAQGVQVNDTIAKGTKVVEVTPPAGATYSNRGGKVTVNVGTLDAGETVTIVIVVDVGRAPLPVDNTATVTTTSQDTNQDNNTVNTTANELPVT